MTTVRKAAKSHDVPQMSAESVRRTSADAYIFCDKKTGSTKFTVDAGTNGDLPIDRIAGALAVFCVAHYCSPKDLLMVVRVEEALYEKISDRALSILKSARIGAPSVALTPREREVLRAVANNLCNKEIAFQLSISVRTVKFHVSALLGKFGVSMRSQLSEFSTERMYDASHVSGNATSKQASQ